MKRILGFILTVGALLLLALGAAADCNRYRAATVYHAPAVYAAPTYVAPVAAYVPVYTPVYSVQYDPTGGAAGLAILEELKAAREETRTLRAEMKALAARPPDAPPPAYAPRASPGGSLFASKCAGCHDASVAVSKGAPVLFTKGEVLNREGIPERIMQVLRTGKMGTMKAPPLSDSERLAMTYHLFDLPAPEAAPGPGPAAEPKK